MITSASRELRADGLKSLKSLKGKKGQFTLMGGGGGGRRASLLRMVLMEARLPSLGAAKRKGLGIWSLGSKEAAKVSESS